MYMKIKSAAFCKKLETELSERKRRTRRIESSRLQEVYSRNPEIKKLDDNLATIALDMGRQLMNAGNSEEIRGLANALIEKNSASVENCLYPPVFPPIILTRNMSVRCVMIPAALPVGNFAAALSSLQSTPCLKAPVSVLPKTLGILI